MSYRITEKCTGCGHCVQWCPTRAIKGRRKIGYTIENGQCIDCGACGKICTHSAILDSYGNISLRMPISQWKRPIWDVDTCIICDNCLRVCPVRCIQTASRDEPEKALVHGFPFLNRPGMCLGCGFCELSCQVNAIQMVAKSESRFK